MDGDVCVSKFDDDVTSLAIVDCVQYSLVTLLDPVVTHSRTRWVLPEIVCTLESGDRALPLLSMDYSEFSYGLRPLSHSKECAIGFG